MDRTKLRGHTEFELRLALRQERHALIKERSELIPKIRRLNEIEDRLCEIEKAEYLLDNYG